MRREQLDRMTAALLEGYCDLAALTRITGATETEVREYLRRFKRAGHLMASPIRYHLVDKIRASAEKVDREPVQKPMPGRKRVMDQALEIRHAHGLGGTHQAAGFIERIGMTYDIGMIALLGLKRAREIYGIELESEYDRRKARKKLRRAA